MPHAHAPEELVVFLGPTLPADAARARVPCTVLPPARQGDVWRALSRGPRAIALVDGVFEAQPSVWHHELLAALDAGVAVFGASSMGALRAAELAAHGVVGVGRIFEGYRDGRLVDDADVALLHAGPEHGHRPFTVPLVNARHAAEAARAAGVLTAREARALERAAEECFYQERTWPALLAALPEAARARWRAWAAQPGALPDLKRLDAEACLDAAAAFLASRMASTLASAAAASRGAATPARAPRPVSARVRARRVLDGESRAGDAAVRGADVLALLRLHPDADALQRAGLVRLTLAGWARAQGLTVPEARVREAEARWLAERGVAAEDRAAWLAALGLDAADAWRLCEDVALADEALARAARLLPDGPGADEALASEARLQGTWWEAVQHALPPAPRAAPRRRRK